MNKLNKEIYFIRHGETSYNKMKINQGQEIDIPLNVNGINQVSKSAAYLKKYRENNSKFQCIYASPMIRTKQTVDIIKKIMKFEGDVIYDDNLKERKNGKLSGIVKSDPFNIVIKEFKQSLQPIDPIERILYYDQIIQLTNDKYNVGIETNKELEERIKPFIQTLKDCSYDKILIVGHHTCLYAIIKTIFNIPQLIDFEFGNCWISYIIYNKNDNQFKMISSPNIQHLNINDHYL